MRLKSREEMIAAVRAKIQADHAAEAKTAANKARFRGEHTCGQWPVKRYDPSCVRCMRIKVAQEKATNK